MDFSFEDLPAAVQLFSGIDKPTKQGAVPCPGHFLFLFVKTGVFGIFIDGRRVLCTAGEFIIAVTKEHYEIFRQSKNLKGCLVNIDWMFIMTTKMLHPFIETLISSGPSRLVPDQLDRRAVWRIMKLLHHFYLVRSSPSRFSASLFSAGLNLLIFQSALLYGTTVGVKGTKHSRKEILTMEFLKLLIEHFRRYRNLKFYADTLCVTEGYLNKAVRGVTGKTVGTCIGEAIINEAKYLLEHSEYTLEAISEQLNFSSYGTFSRFFKKHTNSTPNSYRQHYGG